jgi:hypothetical protein
MEVLFKNVLEEYKTFFYQNCTELPDNYFEKNKNEVKEDEVIDIDSFLNNDYEYIDEFWKYSTKRNPYFKLLTSSDKFEDFKENYGNPICGIRVNRLTIVLEKTDEKISMKVYLYEKMRKRGLAYFTKHTKMKFITYSFKTKDLYSGTLVNGFKKRKKTSSIKKNYFASKPVNSFLIFIKNNIVYNPERKNFLDKTFSHEIDYHLNFMIEKFLSYVIGQTDNSSYDTQLYFHYLKSRGIKYPNNYKSFFPIIPLVKKKFLKKTNYKFVDAFMLQNNLRGDKIKRILHNSENINLYFYNGVKNFFGEKLIDNLDENTLKSIINYKSEYHNFPDPITNFLRKEFKNVFEIFKLTLTFEVNHYSFCDHIRLFRSISNFEKIKWRSYNLETFALEHLEWSDKLQHYTKGTFTRFYSDKFKNKIEEPIEIDGVKYYPVLLKNSKEYNEESITQNNCVKNYIDRVNCFIISLRKESPTSDIRATIEFDILHSDYEDFETEVKIIRTQTLGRFNESLKSEWDIPLKVLDDKMKYVTEYFELPTIEIENGTGNKISSKSIFDKEGCLIWENNQIYSIQPIFLGNVVLDL